MSNYLITPFRVVPFGDLLCVNPTTSRTEVVENFGDFGHSTMDGWFLFECPDLSYEPDELARIEDAHTVAGEISFGVGCGTTSVVIDLEGQLQTMEDGNDWLRIYLNDDLVFEESSVRRTYAEGDPETVWFGGAWVKPYETVANENANFTVEITSDRPCGNVIKIAAGSETNYGQNGTFWFVSIGEIS